MDKEQLAEKAKELGLDFAGEEENGRFVITLADSDEYSRAYSILDKSEMVELDPDSTLVSDRVSELTYAGDGFVVELRASFVDDIYKAVIKEDDGGEGDEQEVRFGD